MVGERKPRQKLFLQSCPFLESHCVSPTVWVCVAWLVYSAVPSAGDWTQSSAHARRASYCWAVSSPHNVLFKGRMIRQWISDPWKLTGTFKSSSVLSGFMLPFPSNWWLFWSWQKSDLLIWGMPHGPLSREWEPLRFHRAVLFVSVSPLELTRTKYQGTGLFSRDRDLWFSLLQFSWDDQTSGWLNRAVHWTILESLLCKWTSVMTGVTYCLDHGSWYCLKHHDQKQHGGGGC